MLVSDRLVTSLRAERVVASRLPQSAAAAACSTAATQTMTSETDAIERQDASTTTVSHPQEMLWTARSLPSTVIAVRGSHKRVYWLLHSQSLRRTRTRSFVLNYALLEKL